MDVLVNGFWLAVCIYYEARGEPDLAQVGVGHVVMNRVIERGMSAMDVIQEDRQFSWYEDGMELIIKEPKAMANCIKMAKDCLTQRMNGDTFGGANHFHDTSIDPPNWTESMVKLGEFGNMIFYKG